MIQFEKIIKREDFTPAEIFNAYLEYYSFFKMPHKPEYYQSWADNEINRIEKYLYSELKTGEHRLKYLSNYIIENERISHFLKHNTIEYIGKYFNDNEGYSILESLNDIKPKDLLILYTDKIIPLHLAQDILIEERKFNGQAVPVHQAVNLTSSMILAKGLLKLYEQSENECDSLNKSTPKEKRRYPIIFTSERIEILEAVRDAGRVKYGTIKDIENGKKFDVMNVNDSLAIEELLQLNYVSEPNYRMAEYFIIKGEEKNNTIWRNRSRYKNSYTEQFKKETGL